MGSFLKWRQRLSNLAAFVSGVLLIASVVVWIGESGLLWSYRVEARRIHFDRLGASRYELELSGGGVELSGFAERALPQASQQHTTQYMREVARRPLLKGEWESGYAYPTGGWPSARLILGFGVFSDDETPQGSVWSEYEYGVIVPCWSLVVLFGIVPTIWLIKRRKRGGAIGVECGACGYNLTGNTSGVCPECGVATQKS